MFGESGHYSTDKFLNTKKKKVWMEMEQPWPSGEDVACAEHACIRLALDSVGDKAMFPLVLLPAHQIFEIKEKSRRILCVLTVSDARTYSGECAGACVDTSAVHAWVGVHHYLRSKRPPICVLVGKQSYFPFLKSFYLLTSFTLSFILVFIFVPSSFQTL
jgi:hypothetical protein